ncbi:hypothetical protein GCM10012286_07280 [Streptomyces lasiicapitis]|uniref:Serine/arginine repetitive matrix protein 2 n=1 Tax=Streptomyces lasiicapitis TaxID=1923961 RepID=A0ABQ2LIW4_9ACTN|nr:hypothetical protein GCM10012286_07280 [Streptomyces lasiicapitis]
MVRIYDRDRQEWVGPEREREIEALHDRDATRQRTARRAAVAVLAVCGLAFGTWALGWKDEPKPTAYLMERQPTQGPGADVGASGTEDAAPPSPEGGPPSGYESVTDAAGFRLAVPIGWTRTGEGGVDGITIVNYHNFDGTRRLQVYEVSEPTPYASLRTFLDDTQVPKSAGFRKLSLTRLDDGPRPAARLTYLTDRASSVGDAPNVGTWHVVDHRFEAEDGKRYAVAAYGPEADGRQDEKELVATALKWFCPALTDCPEPGAG